MKKGGIVMSLKRLCPIRMLLVITFLYTWHSAGSFQTMSLAQTIISSNELNEKEIKISENNLDNFLKKGKELLNNKQYREAIKIFEQALPILITKEDNIQLYECYTGLGSAYISLDSSKILPDIDELKKGIGYYEKGIKIFLRNDYINDAIIRDYYIATCYKLGIIYESMTGDISKAIQLYEEALRVLELVQDKEKLSVHLLPIATSLGNAYLYVGDYKKAFIYFDKGLKFIQINGDKNISREAIVDLLNFITDYYTKLNDYEKANYYIEKALGYLEETDDQWRKVRSLLKLGDIQLFMKNYGQAFSTYSIALDIAEEKKMKNDDIIWAKIGDLLYVQGKYEEAISYYEKSFSGSNLVDTYLKIGKPKEAITIAQRNIFISEKLQNIEEKVDAYYSLAKTLLFFYDNIENSKFIFYIQDEPIESGFRYLFPLFSLTFEEWKKWNFSKIIIRKTLVEDALQCFDKAISLIEKVKNTIPTEQYKRTFLGSKTYIYEDIIRLLLKMQQREKGKSYDKEALQYVERVKSRTFLEMLATRQVKGRDREDENILRKDREFQQELMSFRKRLNTMEETMISGVSVKEIDGLRKAMLEKETTYTAFIEGVKLQNPDLGSLISITPLPIERIQSWLDKDTTLLEYYTAKDAVYAWLVTNQDVKVYEITMSQKELQIKVENMLLPNISDRPRRPQPAMIYAPSSYDKESNEQERKANRGNFFTASQDFYKEIVSPIEKDIKTNNLIIVPYGVLHKVPFSALSDGEKYLIDKYAISVLPAASVMEFVVKKRKTEKEKILVFANPKTDYDSLDAAETEGKAISEMFQNNKLLLGEAATETAAKNNSSDFNIIHFATHGEFNERQPLQSGLLLAQDKDNDGFLQVHEIFSMNLKNANLVTLSACETALSKIQGGDDLVGLSRAFIYAGTPSLLATLWEVYDPSTATLMENFYKNWSMGMSKPEALRQAQITLKKMPGYEHPYYWAPFEMIGDWR